MIGSYPKCSPGYTLREYERLSCRLKCLLIPIFLSVNTVFLLAPAGSWARNNNNNTSPSANAGIDADFPEGDEVALSGTCNDSDEDDNLTGEWTIVSGTCDGPGGNPVRTDQIGRNSDRPRTIEGSCTAPDVDSDTTLVFQLECDDGRATVVDTVEVTVIASIPPPPPPPENNAPVASAGADIEVMDTGEIALSGTCNDSDAGDNLTGEWTIVSGTCDGPGGNPVRTDQIGRNSDRPRTIEGICTAPNVDSNTTITFELVCSDGRATAADTVNVTINASPVARPQAVSVAMNSALEIVLEGMDPNDESLSYTIVDDPQKGALSGTPPVLTYTPGPNATGQDEFLFVVSDGAQMSSAANIYINILSGNEPPACTLDFESGDESQNSGENVRMPAISCTDPDEDRVETSWVQLGELLPGKRLYFTDDNEIDFENQRYKRGTYYTQLVATDEYGNTAVQDTVQIDMPNNPPEFREEEGRVEGMELKYINGGNKFVSPEFLNVLDVRTDVSDYDDDSLSFEWRVSRGSSEFEQITNGGKRARIRIRNAGTTTVQIKADDGYGGVTQQLFTIYQPAPSVSEEDLNLSVFRKSDGAQNSFVIGYLKLPVVPIVYVEGVRAEVSLTSLSARNEAKTAAGVVEDIYMFRVVEMPALFSSSSLDVDVMTDVDGEGVLLFSKSISMEDAEGEEGPQDGGDGRTSFGAGKGGCSLAAGTGQEGHGAAQLILLAAILVLFLSRRFRRWKGLGV